MPYAAVQGSLRGCLLASSGLLWCNRHLSVAVGSTGVHTVTAPAFTGDWHGPGRYGNGPPGDWDGDGHDDRTEWERGTRTWSGGVYTVTGCEWNGNPWAGGPGGWGAGGVAGSPWGPWGSGWKWSTLTQTITQVVTVTNPAGVTVSTSVGLAAVAQAVSGDLTSTSVIGAVDATSTGAGGGSSGAAGGGGAGTGSSGTLGIKVMGAVLGGVVVIAALL
ncbi:uncharacterized protein B0T15DRAFT_546814 [Chaetomium strumarium]|uniref:Uncharacterized protein n=1 Tax=Chaetomium strumarium TaxID=1170767 RepID=A0AAJ0H1U4_9PEZI|nr:hypothetical protein B0T15DRAFT_546814 [Chaetomium strumarium]